jgi:heptaprenyl diphosphate synthase
MVAVMATVTRLEQKIEVEAGRIRAKLEYILQRHLPLEISAELIPLRGKLNRARLVLGFALLGGMITPVTVAVACGMELLHLASLFQDDLIDQSGFRQGRPAFFKTHGAGAAVLLSDWLFGEAYRLLGRGGLIGLEQTNRMIKRMALSELQQELPGRRGAQLSVFGSLRYTCNKTALLFANCCKFGFQTVQNDPRQSVLAAKTGLWWGMAYQLGNDLQDLLIEPGVGLNGDHDRHHGCFTLPLLLLLYQKAELKPVIGTLPQVELLALLQNSGAIDETLRIRQNCLAKSRRSLAAIEAHPAAQEVILKWLEQSEVTILSGDLVFA